MADEVTHEDVMRVRRWECHQRGHSFIEMVEAGALDPVSVVCENCGEAWTVDTGRLEEVKVRCIARLADLDVGARANHTAYDLGQIVALEKVVEWITEEDEDGAS